MWNLTLQTIIWVLAFGSQIASIARSQTVCRRPDFDETLISITPDQSNYTLYDVIRLSCLRVADFLTGGSNLFTCQPSTLWRAPGFSECDPSTCTSSLYCLGPCGLNSVDDDVDFDGTIVEDEGEILVRHGLGVIFRCDGVLLGNDFLTCSDTVWSGAFPICQAECHLKDLGGYLASNDTTRQHGETLTYQCGTESIEVTCDDGVWMSDTECTLNTTTLPRVTTEMSTTDVTTTVMSPETTTVEVPTTTATTEIPTSSITVVSTTELQTIFLSTGVPTKLSTTTKPTDALTTTKTTQVPTTSTISEVLTTTKAAEVPTTTEEVVTSTTDKSTTEELVTIISQNLTTEKETTITTTPSAVSTRMGSTTSVETPDSTITTAGNSTITTAGNSTITTAGNSTITTAGYSTITTAVSTTESACSYCNFTIEYCGEDDICVCRPGFFRQSDECIRSRTFYTTMAISQYNGSNASLSMINDADEEVLTKQIISLINLIFSEQSDYLGCVVFRLTSGSIIADIVTYFNTSTSLNETKISDVINDGFETQNQSAIVIVPERTVTQAAFDECELNLDDCHELAECTDTAEYFMCTCLEHTIDQLQGGLDGRLCEPRATVPEMDMSTSESPMSTADTMPVDRSFLIVLIVLIAVIVIFVFLACCLAWINSRSIGSKSGFDLKAAGRQASIEVLGIADRKESPTNGKPFKIEIKEDDGLLISTTVEAAQALGESIDNPAYVSAGPDVEAPHEMDSYSTPGRTSNPQDMSMTDPTYAEPDAIDDKTKNKMPADGGDPSAESPNREGNDTATSKVDVIYAQPVPKSERPPSQKDTSKKEEEEPTEDRNSIGLGDLASTMATFPSSGARKLSALFEEEATTL